MVLLNEHVEHEVTQTLIQTGHVSSQRIEVVASDGTVTLRGDVQSFRQKLAAQTAVESCKGVAAVINELTVSPPEPVMDSTIAYNVNGQLAADTELVSQSIRVDSRKGLLTLTGYVETTDNKNKAVDLVSSVDGVREVQCMLVVNPDRVFANLEHAASIQREIAHTIGLANEKLVLSVVDETARLSGEVDAIWKKETAEKIVRQFKILNVCNEIVVSPEKI